MYCLPHPTTIELFAMYLVEQVRMKTQNWVSVVKRVHGNKTDGQTVKRLSKLLATNICTLKQKFKIIRSIHVTFVFQGTHRHNQLCILRPDNQPSNVG